MKEIENIFLIKYNKFTQSWLFSKEIGAIHLVRHCQQSGHHLGTSDCYMSYKWKLQPGLTEISQRQTQVVLRLKAFRKRK